MKIFIRTLDNENIAIKCEPNETIRQIKEAEKTKSALEIEVKSWEVSLNKYNLLDFNKIKLWK